MESETDIQFYLGISSLESIDQNFLTIITKTTQVQEGGTTIPRYSLAFDIPQAVKDKINNNTRIIQIEPTNLTDLVYPLDLTPTDIFILPLKTRANDFIDILLQPPASEGSGRSITIDLKDTVKTKINNIKTIIIESMLDPTIEAQVGTIQPAANC